MTDRAAELGQDLRKREFKDQSWLGLKTRSRDATLSRHKGININELYLHTKLPSTSPTGEVWRGKWQGNEIAAKVSTKARGYYKLIYSTLFSTLPM